MATIYTLQGAAREINEGTEEKLQQGSVANAHQFSVTKDEYGFYSADVNADEEDKNNTGGETDRTESTKGDELQTARPKVHVPELSTSLGLDIHGRFVEHVTGREKSKVRSESSRIENDTMDEMAKARMMSYVEVTSKEKRDVYKLDVVKRCMRRLPFAGQLLSYDNLEISKRYMEIGPNRASIISIGRDCLLNRNRGQLKNDNGRKEIGGISGFLRILMNLQGHHWFFWPVQIIAFSGDMAYWIIDISRADPNMINISSLTSILWTAPINIFMTWQDAYGHCPPATESDFEDMWLSQIVYLALTGMDVLGAAQERMSQELNKPITGFSNIKQLKEDMKRAVMLETIFIHILVGFAPMACASLITAYRRWDYDRITAILSLCFFWSRAIQVSSLGGMAYLIRLSQCLANFEIRRVQTDVRTCPATLIHRITPRFKALLHECHMIGNKGHSYFVFLLPALSVYTIQLVAGIFMASLAVPSDDTTDDYDDNENTSGFVPTWCFFAVSSPIITTLIWIFNYGRLNMAIERDVDQDIVEMNIRLTFSDSHVPNWLLQQMVCLERLDGRAFGLPLDFIPSIDTARTMGSSFITAVVFLGPYLMTIIDKLTSELSPPQLEQ